MTMQHMLLKYVIKCLLKFVLILRTYHADPLLRAENKEMMNKTHNPALTLVGLTVQ